MAAKQVICIRKDLNMRRGKEIAQGSHASTAWMTKHLNLGAKLGGGRLEVKFTKAQAEWFLTGTTKICVKVNSEEELLDIYQRAQSAGLEVHLITDAGRTEFGGVPTKTCLAIGPDDSDKIDKITAHLSLY